MTYTGSLHLKWGTFFRLQIYESVGISLVDVYKRVGKCVTSFCKKAQRGSKKHFMALKKLAKCFGSFDLFISKRQCIFQQLKGMQCSKLGTCSTRGTICQLKVWNGYLFLSNMTDANIIVIILLYFNFNQMTVILHS